MSLICRKKQQSVYDTVRLPFRVCRSQQGCGKMGTEFRYAADNAPSLFRSKEERDLEVPHSPMVSMSLMSSLNPFIHVTTNAACPAIHDALAALHVSVSLISELLRALVGVGFI